MCANRCHGCGRNPAHTQQAVPCWAGLRTVIIFESVPNPVPVLEIFHISVPVLVPIFAIFSISVLVPVPVLLFLFFLIRFWFRF